MTKHGLSPPATPPDLPVPLRRRRTCVCKQAARCVYGEAVEERVMHRKRLYDRR